MLGSNICFVMNKNFNVTGTYLSNKPNISNIPMIKMDIRNKEECQKAINKINPDIVIHCAAITNMDLCEKDKKLAYDVNTYGTKNILESINRDCHLIFISTDNVYNNEKQFNRENAKKNITNIYGDTKRKAEKIIMGSSVNSTILRTNIFGWHLGGKKTGLFHFIYENLSNQNEITLFYDVFYTPISIPLFINGLKKIIEDRITGTFNFGGRERISKLEFGLIIADVFGLKESLIKPISIDEKPFLAKRPKEMSINSNKFQKYFTNYKDINSQIKDLSKFHLQPTK